VRGIEVWGGLDEAQAGAPIAICEPRGWDGSAWFLRRITRATKTFVVLDDGTKWTRGGVPWGDSRDTHSLLRGRTCHLVTDEAAARADIAAEQKKRRLDTDRRSLRDIVEARWRELPEPLVAQFLPLLRAAFTPAEGVK
jgi:hypothetical protein